MTIVEFLTAHYDEDEQMIRVGESGLPSYWVRNVLADIAAKRRIVELLEEPLIVAPSGYGNDQIQINTAIDHAAERAKIMKLLASVYADHPDYRPEWGVNPPP